MWARATASWTAVVYYRLRTELKLSVRNSILRGAEATKDKPKIKQTKNYWTKVRKDTRCPHIFHQAWTYISIRTWASATTSWTAAASSAWGQNLSSQNPKSNKQKISNYNYTHCPNIFLRAWTYISIRTWAIGLVSNRNSLMNCSGLVRNFTLLLLEVCWPGWIKQTNLKWRKYPLPSYIPPGLNIYQYKDVSKRNSLMNCRGLVRYGRLATAWGQYRTQSSVRNSILGGHWGRRGWGRPQRICTRSGSRTTWELKTDVPHIIQPAKSWVDSSHLVDHKKQAEQDIFVTYNVIQK